MKQKSEKGKATVIYEAKALEERAVVVGNISQ